MSSTADGTSIELVAVLKSIGKEELFRYFEKRLQVSKQLTSRPALLKGFARLGKDRARRVLEAVTTDFNESLEARQAAIQGLVEIAIDLPDAPFRGQLEALLERLLDDSDVGIASTAAAGLVNLGASGSHEKLAAKVLVDALEPAVEAKVRAFLAAVDARIPDIGHTLHRSELHVARERLGSARLVVISGVPGIGKTALAAQLAREFRGEAIWLSCVRFKDGTFLAEEAVRQLKFRKQGVRTSSATRTDRGLSAHIRAFREHLPIRGETLVIIDDADVLSDDAGLAEFVSQLLAATERVRVIVVGRSTTLTEKSFPDGEVIVLKPLSEESTKEFILAELSRRGISADRERVVEIAALAAGSPLLIRLAVDKLAKGGDFSRQLSVSLRDVINQALAKLSPVELRALQIFALFDESVHVDEDGIYQIFREENVPPGSEWMAELINIGLLSAGTSGSLSMHRAVRDALREQIDTRTFGRVNGLIAQYYRDRGQIFLSGLHFLRAGKIQAALEVIRPAFDDIVGQGHAAPVREALLEFTRQQTTGVNEAFLLAGELSEAMGDYTSAAQYYLKARNNSVGDVSTLGVISPQIHIARARLLEGQIDLAMQLYRQVLDGAPPVSAYEEGLARVGLGKAYALKGNYRDASDFFLTALESANRAPSVELRAITMTELGDVYSQLGRANDAVRTLNEAIDASRAVRNRKIEAQALASLGVGYSRLGDPQNAIVYLEKAGEIFADIGDARGQANAIMATAEVAAGQQTATKSIELHSRAVAIYRRIGDRHKESESLVVLARSYRALGELRTAIGLLKNSLELAQRLGDQVLIARQMEQLADVHLEIGDTSSARHNLETALQIWHRQEDEAGQLGATIKLAALMQMNRDIDTALALFEDALQRARALGRKRDEIEIIRSLAKTHVHKGDLITAVHLLRAAVEANKSTGDPKGQSLALAELSQLLSQTGQYADALNQLKEALFIARTNGDSRSELQILSGLAELFNQTGSPSQVLETYEEVLALAQRTGDTEHEELALARMADLYAISGNFARTIGLYEDALRTARDSRRPELLWKLASAHADAGDLLNGVDALRRAVAHSKQIGDSESECVSLVKLSMLYIRLQDTARAQSTIDHATTIMDEIQSRLAAADVSAGISEVFCALKDFKRAVTFAKKAYELARHTGDKGRELRAFVTLALRYLESGNAHLAIATLNDALPLARYVGAKEDVAGVFLNLARAYRSAGKSSLAEDAQREAAALTSPTALGKA